LHAPLKADTVDQRVAAHFRAAQDAFRQGDFRKAVEEYKQVLQLDPSRIEARVNLALTFHSLGDYQLAIEEFEQVQRRNPALLVVNLFLGIDYLKVQLPQKAMIPLEKAVQMEPFNKIARRAMAACYLEMDQYLQAAEQFVALASAEKDRAEALYSLAHGYLDMARRIADDMSGRHQNTSWAKRMAGDLLASTDRWADAAVMYSDAVGLDPKQPELHVDLGRMYLHQKKFDNSESEFKGALRLDQKDQEAWLGLAEIALENGNVRLTLECLEEAWNIFPPFLGLQPEFPSPDIGAERAAQLAADVGTTIQTPWRAFLLSRLHEMAGEVQKAQEESATFEDGLAAWQQHSSHHLGSISDPCNSHQYAACINRLRSKPSLSISDRLSLGKALFTLGSLSKASATFASALSTEKDNLATLYWLARTYRRLSDDTFTELVQHYPDSWRAHQFLGQFNLLRYAYDDAVGEYQKAIQLDPNEAELHEALGRTYLLKQSHIQAVEELKKAVELDPGRARSLYWLGQAYLDLHREQESIACLEKAVHFDPGLLEAHAALGQAYARENRPELALPELEKAASIDTYGDLHYLMSVAFRKLGKTDLAQKALMRSEELRKLSAASHQMKIAQQLDF
jgi:tetratricopeptide (TPR) repeat protein